MDESQAKHLFHFLPGTGTPPSKVTRLITAAKKQGYYALALGYASLPIAVSQMNLWCTRSDINATKCNMELHESVLFGVPNNATQDGGGLWNVPPEQSVESLLTAGLKQLGWSAFLTNDGTGVHWERIVVSAEWTLTRRFARRLPLGRTSRACGCAV